jgi:HK97 gp10 family phage protein
MAKVEGFKELSRKLSKMGEAAGGKALRSAAMSSMLPAFKDAKANAPVGNPPFEGGKDPYPIKTYKGNLRVPGFAKRNVARKSRLSRDKRKANVYLGVKPEAFYAINFIEFGTATIAKRPWLEPSFRRSIPTVRARLSERLKKLIDKASKK